MGRLRKSDSSSHTVSRMIRLSLVLCLFASASGATIPSPLEEYIVGGRPTDIEEVPYQIALLTPKNEFICGGSIVSETHILTAAHCVVDTFYQNSAYNIRAGSSNKTRGGTVIASKSVVHHPKFNTTTLDYDIAVIELSSPLKFNNRIKVIPLATSEPVQGDPVKVSGWGCLKENGTRPTQLHSVVVPVVNRKKCEKSYQDYYPVTKRMFCAGVEGKDSCQGDSGGPIALRGTLVGVVSFGVGCARDGFPGVYTNIADPDIRKYIKEKAKV